MFFLDFFWTNQVGLVFGIRIQTDQTALALLENSHFESVFQRHPRSEGVEQLAEKQVVKFKSLEVPFNQTSKEMASSLAYEVSRYTFSWFDKAEPGKTFFSFGFSETENKITEN